MTKELKEEYIRHAINLGKFSSEQAKQRHAKWLKSDVDDVFMLDSYYYIIDKESINTTFCYGYGQNGISTLEESDRADAEVSKAQESIENFINSNMESINTTIGKLKYFIEENHDERENIKSKYGLPYSIFRYTPYVSSRYYNSEENVAVINYVRDDENAESYNIRKATKEDLVLVLGEYEKAKERFKKRLLTYLKRFGLTKVRAWSFLVD